MNDTTKEIKTSKVDIETFDIKIEKITEKFKLTDQNITKINDEFYFRDVFFDKYFFYPGLRYVGFAVLYMLFSGSLIWC